MMRHWRLIREPSYGGATIGALYLDGVWFSWTLEDTVREVSGQPVATWKIAGQTAIPAGDYEVALSASPKFQRELPELLDVPGFSGIRIHAGNTSADTEGCILVGFGRGESALAGGTSRPAEVALVTKLKTAHAAGDDVWIRIENPQG